MAEAVVHGIDRHTDDHLCGEPSGYGTDAWEPSTPITCEACLEAGATPPPPTLAARARRLRYRLSPRHLRSLADARIRDWRQQWAPGVSVAAVVYAHRQILDDQPQLRGLIDHELRGRVAAATPLRWRYDEARHHWANLRRAVHGEPSEPLPWEYTLDLMVSTEDPASFEQGRVAIRGERRRLPRRDTA